MGYKSTEIANEVMSNVESYKDGEMTPLRLQRIVYICYSWTLGALDFNLVEEDVEARWWGPVFKELFDLIKSSEKGNKVGEEYRVNNIIPYHKEFIKKTYGAVRTMGNKDMSDYVCLEYSPWGITRKGEAPFIIDPLLIKVYYRDELIKNGWIVIDDQVSREN